MNDSALYHWITVRAYQYCMLTTMYFYLVELQEFLGQLKRNRVGQVILVNSQRGPCSLTISRSQISYFMLNIRDVILRFYDSYHAVFIYSFNPLNAELNPIRHLLALVGARHVVHISRIRVKSHPPFASIGRSSPFCPRQQSKG